MHYTPPGRPKQQGDCEIAWISHSFRSYERYKTRAARTRPVITRVACHRVIAPTCVAYTDTNQLGNGTEGAREHLRVRSRFYVFVVAGDICEEHLCNAPPWREPTASHSVARTIATHESFWRARVTRERNSSTAPFSESWRADVVPDCLCVCGAKPCLASPSRFASPQRERALGRRLAGDEPITDSKRR